MHKLLRKPLVRINDKVGRRLGFKLRRVPYSRPSTLKAKAVFGDQPIRVVEIGCAAGNNALDILRQLNVVEYVAIDPYEKTNRNYDDYDRPRLARMREQSRRLLRHYADRIVWVREDSSYAVTQLKGAFDYIYVDGDHAHQGVLADMKAYYELLGHRFVFGGHDIDSPGVARAFVDFVSSRSIENYEIKDPDWIVYGE